MKLVQVLFTFLLVGYCRFAGSQALVDVEALDDLDFNSTLLESLTKRMDEVFLEAALGKEQMIDAPDADSDALLPDILDYPTETIPSLEPESINEIPVITEPLLNQTIIEEVIGDIEVRISPQAITTTQKMKLEDLPLEMQQEILAKQKEQEERLRRQQQEQEEEEAEREKQRQIEASLRLANPPISNEEYTRCSAELENVTTQYALLQQNYTELERRYANLQSDHEKKQQLFDSLSEQLHTLHKNNSLQEIANKLLQNELAMTKLLSESNQLKHESLTIQLEEKILGYQKELLKLNNQLKENHKKYQLSMKYNCTPSSSTAAAAGNTAYSAQESFTAADRSRSRVSGSTARALSFAESVNSVLQSLFPFLPSFVKLPPPSSDRVVIEEELVAARAAAPTRASNLGETVEGMSTPGQPSPAAPNAVGSEVPTLDYLITLPASFFSALYYQYSMLYHLLFQVFPEQFPFITEAIFQPIGNLFYQGLGIEYLVDSGSNYYEQNIATNEMMQDLTNEFFFRFYYLLHFLENEDNSSLEAIEYYYQELNTGYILPLVNAVRPLLPGNYQSLMEHYLLLALLSIGGLIFLWFTYRIWVGLALCLLLVFAFPYLVVFYLLAKLTGLFLSLTDKILSTFLNVSLYGKRATTPKKSRNPVYSSTPTEEELRRNARRRKPNPAETEKQMVREALQENSKLAPGLLVQHHTTPIDHSTIGV